LKGTGPFTVFAPTDDAFKALLKALGATKEQLLARADLADILKYHVHAGASVKSSALTNGQKIPTLQGDSLTVAISGKSVSISGATVTTADVAASNGIIHVIDKVLVPPTKETPKAKDIVDTAVAAGYFTILAQALTKAKLVDALKGTGPFTVFAPTDDAFKALLKALGATKEQLLARADLADILKYHVHAGASVKSSALTNGQKIPTLQGDSLTVAISGKSVSISGATVTTADVAASNGIIHVIDKVLVPTKKASPSPSPASTTVSGAWSARGAVSGLVLLASLGFGLNA